MSEANKDLLEKYRKEVALRRKYHEQLVELKGMVKQVPDEGRDWRRESLCSIGKKRQLYITLYHY
jgi:hypothetical protein